MVSSGSCFLPGHGTCNCPVLEVGKTAGGRRAVVPSQCCHFVGSSSSHQLPTEKTA